VKDVRNVGLDAPKKYYIILETVEFDDGGMREDTIGEAPRREKRK